MLFRSEELLAARKEMNSVSLLTIRFLFQCVPGYGLLTLSWDPGQHAIDSAAIFCDRGILAICHQQLSVPNAINSLSTCYGIPQFEHLQDVFTVLLQLWRAWFQLLSSSDQRLLFWNGVMCRNCFHPSIIRMTSCQELGLNSSYTSQHLQIAWSFVWEFSSVGSRRIAVSFLFDPAYGLAVVVSSTWCWVLAYCVANTVSLDYSQFDVESALGMCLPTIVPPASFHSSLMPLADANLRCTHVKKANMFQLLNNNDNIHVSKEQDKSLLVPCLVHVIATRAASPFQLQYCCENLGICQHPYFQCYMCAPTPWDPGRHINKLGSLVMNRNYVSIVLWPSRPPDRTKLSGMIPSSLLPMDVSQTQSNLFLQDQGTWCDKQYNSCKRMICAETTQYAMSPAVPHEGTSCHISMVDRGKCVPSFDEMMDIALEEVDFDDPTMNVRVRRALAIAKPTPRGY